MRSIPLPRRDLAGGLLSSVIDLANFQAAPISLQGLSESNISMLQVGRLGDLRPAACFAEWLGWHLTAV
jgi:hypothetical protein